MKEVERKAGALMEVLRAEEPRRIAEAIVKTDNWDWDWVIGLEEGKGDKKKRRLRREGIGFG